MRDEFTLSDMQIYGAADTEELSGILDALDRANGPSRERTDLRGPTWARVLRELMWSVDAVASTDIPDTPGVHIWLHDDEPVYIGEACGKEGLRGGLAAHLATDTDLSRSTFRASHNA